MKKKGFPVFFLLLMLLFVFPKTTFAAVPGSMMSNAINIQFGETYYKNWGRATDHLNHYCKITLPSRGELSFMASKPYDDEGEYGKLSFTLFDEDGEIIWDYGCTESCKDARDFYKFKVGLNSGTYYMTILPKFRVISGRIETNYSFGFKPNEYCEIEPNNSLAQATTLSEGYYYSGQYGYDYGNYAKDDYYKMSLKARTTYKIAMSNFAKVQSTTTLLEIIDPIGKKDSVKGSMNSLVDEDGRNYLLYIPSITGTYYIHLHNYSRAQYDYSIGYSRYQKKDQKITGVASSYKKALNTTSFNIKASAVGNITVSSSNSKVASVSYSSYRKNLTVRIHGVGTATITVTAQETSMYKKAQKKFTVSVSAPTVTLVSVKNNPGKVLDITWRCNYSSRIKGYQYQVSTSKAFKSGIKTFKSAPKWGGVYLTDSMIKKNKTYYVRVRSYAVQSGKTIYSSWSTTKSVKVRK